MITKNSVKKRYKKVSYYEFEENGFKTIELYSDVAGKNFSSESTEFAIVARK